MIIASIYYPSILVLNTPSHVRIIFTPVCLSPHKLVPLWITPRSSIYSIGLCRVMASHCLNFSATRDRYSKLLSNSNSSPPTKNWISYIFRKSSKKPSCSESPPLPCILPSMSALCSTTLAQPSNCSSHTVVVNKRSLQGPPFTLPCSTTQSYLE